MAKKPMTTEEKTRRQKKCKSVRHLAENIHRLRNKVTRDLKSEDEKTRLTALAIALIDKTAERVGNSQSANNGHFGVTGWRNKHVTIDGNTITLKYVGKSGVDHEKQVTNETIAKMLKDLKSRHKGNKPLLTTDDGISIKSAQVNRYLSEYDVTAKDIRGYAANTLLVNMLKNSKKPTDEKERLKKFREVMKSVAEKVGHQQATLKQHYLLPGIEEEYVKHSRIKEVKNASTSMRVASSIGHDFTVWRVVRWAAERIKEYDSPMVPTNLETRVRAALKNWETPKHYESWDGFEKFHLCLSKAVDSVFIESPTGSPWYGYPSETDTDPAGMDFRYIINEPDNPTCVVNVHCTIQDETWSLATTIYSTNEIDEAVTPIGHFDPWVRSMLWSIKVFEIMQEGGNEYNEQIADLKRRAKTGQRIWKRIKQLKPLIDRACWKFLGRPADFPSHMIVVISDWDLPEGKIGSYNYGDNEPWGKLAVSPKAFTKQGLAEIVVKHELIHAALGISDDPHGPEFQKIAEYMGIPKGYQD